MSLRSIAQKVLGMITPEGEAEARAVVRLPRASYEQELQLWELLRRYPHTLKLTGAKLPPQPAPPVVLPPQPYFVDFIRDSFVLRVSEQQSEQINMIPKVKYDRKTNLYTVPFRLYPVLQLHKFVKATGLYYTDAAKERILAMYYEMRDRHKASMAHDAEIDMGLFGQALDPYQRAGIKGALRFKRGIIADAMGLGKLLATDTLILTAWGWRKMGTLKAGEFVIGSDGQRTRITGVYPQGVKSLYRVRFSDGSSVEAGDEHLWTVRYKRGGKYWAEMVLTTKQLRERPVIGKLDLAKTTLHLPMLTAPVQFNSSALSVNPYLLGQLIANGSLSGDHVALTINTADLEDVLQRLGEIPTSEPDVHGGAARFNIYRHVKQIKALGLNVKSADKFIPEIYKHAAPLERVALLQGLMDGDGSITKANNKICYHTISLRLAKDVQELVECLGGIASVRTYDRTHEGKPVEYQVRVRCPEWVLPFSTRRKAERYNPGRLARPRRTLTSVEYSRDTEAVCIAVDAPDALYVTEHCILTHNTRQALGCFFLSEGYPWLVIAPASVSINWEKEAMEAVAKHNALVPPGERFRVWRASSRKAPFHTCARSATQLTLFEHALIFDDNCRACQFETSHLILVTYGQIKDGWKCQYDEKGKKIKGRKREKNEPAEIQLSPLATAIASLGLRGLIVDEFHKIKSEQAQQSKAVAALAVGAEYRYGLSGTPIKNRASELIFPLRVLDRLDDLGGEDIFHREFGESAPGDSRPYRRLHKMLRAIGYIRREKRDVRRELPPIRYAKVWVDIDNREEYARVEKDVVGWCAEQAVLKEEFQRMLGELSPDDQGEAIERKLIETRLRVMRAQALIRVGALKRVAARGKLTAAKEWIADFLENDKPLVVFVIHMTLYKDIQETFNCLHIRGADSIKNRQLHKEIFQRESANVLGLNDRMIICTNAAQEGINLDAADDIVQLELQWTPAEEDQIDARVDRHRAHNITSYKFVANETIEERIIAKLEAKRAIMEAVTSGRATGDAGAVAKESVFDEVWADLTHYSMANHRSEFDVGARAKAELDEIRARASSASPEEIVGDAEEAEATDAEFFEETIQIGG